MAEEEPDGLMKCVPEDLVISYVCNNATEDSPLRRLLVDFWGREENNKLLDEWESRETIPSGFLPELAKKLFLVAEGKLYQPLEPTDSTRTSRASFVA